jgi:hypothetical protein
MMQKLYSGLCYAAAAVLVLLSAGCGYLGQTPPERHSPPVETNAAKYDAGRGNTLTSVESSLLLSEKYAVLAVDSEKLRQENKRLIDENAELARKNARLQSELDQTAKELKDANAMLVDMRVEINNWRNSVLGFRGEMREAQKAQLEALLKIMQILSGESRPEAVAAAEPDANTNADK